MDGNAAFMSYETGHRAGHPGFVMLAGLKVPRMRPDGPTARQPGIYTV
jgi:hypothetical protein